MVPELSGRINLCSIGAISYTNKREEGEDGTDVGKVYRFTRGKLSR